MSAFVEDCHDRIRHNVVRHIGAPGQALLDIGGGIGATAAALKSRGFGRAAVIDQADKANVSPQTDADVRADLADPGMTRATIGDQGPFATNFCLDILEHLLNPGSLLRALPEATGRGTRLIASLPNVSHCSASFPLGRWSYRDVGVLNRTHLPFFTRASAARIIGANGFAIEGIHPTGSTRALKVFVKKLLKLISLGLLSRFIDHGYVIDPARAPDPERQGGTDLRC